jgi:hypothetical protein
MRFRSKLGRLRAATWVAYGALLTADLSARLVPFWIALSAGVLTAFLFLLSYYMTYWEILPDRLVEHRLFARSVLMFVEIVALNPMSIAAREDEPTPGFVEVRGVAGRRILVETPHAHRFLTEILEHLPPLPLPV